MAQMNTHHQIKEQEEETLKNHQVMKQQNHKLVATN